MSKIAPLFTWRSAVSSPPGPENSTTRYVLLALSLFMSEHGDSCFPSAHTLAENTGLTERSVRKHLKIAIESGWLKKEKHGFKGNKWARNEYEASIPNNYYKKAEAWKKSKEENLHYGTIPVTKKASDEKKEKAQRKISNAKSSGKIYPKNCLVCGNEKTEAHHYNYDKPMDVYWLCKKHHLQLHRSEKYGKVAFDSEQPGGNENNVNGGEYNSSPLGRVVNEVPKGGELKGNRVVNEVHTNTSYNSSKNTPEKNARENIGKILKGIPIPLPAKTLFKDPAFRPAFLSYWLMRKQQYNQWPAGASVQATYMKLAEMKEAGQDPAAVLNQSTMKDHKELYPVRDFKSSSQQSKEEERMSKLPYYQEL